MRSSFSNTLVVLTLFTLGSFWLNFLWMLACLWFSDMGAWYQVLPMAEVSAYMYMLMPFCALMTITILSGKWKLMGEVFAGVVLGMLALLWLLGMFSILPIFLMG